MILSSGKMNLWLIVISLTLGVLDNFFIYSGIKTLGASTASIFEIMYPFFVVLFSFFLFKQDVSGYFVLGALLIFSGAFVIIRFG